MRALLAVAVLALLVLASPFTRAAAAKELPAGATDVTADALSGLRATSAGAPLSHALEACGVTVVRHATPPKLNGLWLAERRTIVLADSLDAVEARIVLGHEATHASRACLRRTPPMPAHAQERAAWVEAMLNEEVEAIMTETTLARELAEGDPAAVGAAVGRRPFAFKVLALEAHGMAPVQVRAAIRAEVGQMAYRTFYEAMFALSAERN